MITNEDGKEIAECMIRLTASVVGLVRQIPAFLSEAVDLPAREQSFYYTSFLQLKEANRCQRIIRMNSECFERLFSLVEEFYGAAKNRTISNRERLVFTLHYLSQGICLRSLADFYAISAGSASQILAESLRAIKQGLAHLVSMPAAPREWKEKAARFWDKYQLPHCVAAMDGKHIRIQAPPHSGSSYFNYHDYFSVVLLAVVDADRRFLFFDVGSKGRNNDAQVFRTSPLYQHLTHYAAALPTPDRLPGSNVIFPYYIAADGIFPLMPFLLKPHPGLELDALQQLFNKRFSRGRSVVENAFGCLIRRFRLLRMPIEISKERVIEAVKCIIYLHNFLLDEAYEEEEEDGYGFFADLQGVPDDDNEEEVNLNTLRESLADYFVNEGRIFD